LIQFSLFFLVERLRLSIQKHSIQKHSFIKKKSEMKPVGLFQTVFLSLRGISAPNQTPFTQQFCSHPRICCETETNFQHAQNASGTGALNTQCAPKRVVTPKSVAYDWAPAGTVEGFVAEGTVAEGTVAEGTVAEGTVAEGTAVP